MHSDGNDTRGGWDGVHTSQYSRHARRVVQLHSAILDTAEQRYFAVCLRVQRYQAPEHRMPLAMVSSRISCGLGRQALIPFLLQHPVQRAPLQQHQVQVSTIAQVRLVSQKTLLV